MKKWLVFICVVVFSLVLVACGNDQQNTSSTPSGPSNSNQGASSENTEKKSDFPNKALTLIVPYAAGGGTDLIARPLASLAEKYLGQPIAVVNKTGGGGAVGMTEGANAKPDGYTLTFVTVESTILHHLGLASFSYKDFKPIILVNYDPSVLTVPANAPYNTLQEFIEYAKNNPGLQVGNGGANGIWHMAAAEIERAAGVKFTHVPFDGGKPAVTSLLGGHIDAVTVSAGEVLEQVKAGQLKTLAVLGDERIDSMPDVPTFKESGIEATQIGSWKGVAVPKDTPDDIAKILEDAFMKSAQEEEFVNYMKNAGLQMLLKDSAGFAQTMQESDAFFGKLIPELGVN